MIRTATSLSWRNLAAKSDLASLNLFSRSIVSSSALGPRVFSAPLSRGFSRTQCTQTLHAGAQVSPINFGRIWWSRANVHPIETTFHRSVADSFLSLAVWLIKRTYQPSLLKKKRQCGYMKRQQSVGGRRILKRRRQKGRKRLFGA